MYQELTIGSAPPSAEEMQRADHHFIADRSIHDPITAGEYERFALGRLQTLFTENKVVIAVGGSGMYIDALLNGLDPLPTNADIKADLDEQFAADGLAPLVAKLQELDPAYARK